MSRQRGAVWVGALALWLCCPSPAHTAPQHGTGPEQQLRRVTMSAACVGLSDDLSHSDSEPVSLCGLMPGFIHSPPRNSVSGEFLCLEKPSLISFLSNYNKNKFSSQVPRLCVD